MILTALYSNIPLKLWIMIHIIMLVSVGHYFIQTKCVNQQLIFDRSQNAKNKALQTVDRQKYPEDVCPVVFPSLVQSSLLCKSKLW